MKVNRRFLFKAPPKDEARELERIVSSGAPYLVR